MTNKTEALNQIAQFEAHYQYDSAYMRDLLEHSPDGFAKFNNFLPLARHHEKLDNNDYWVAKLAAMQAADCGECLQLNVRMALEAGISKELIQAILRGGDALPADLLDVYHYAKSVATNIPIQEDLRDRIEARFDKGELLEFALAIATTAVFPGIKRALGLAKACSLVEIEV